MLEAVAIEVFEYQTEDGRSPFQDWLDHLP